jgi:flagellar hook-length control protein FliK
VNLLSIPTPTIHAGSTLSSTTTAGKAETAPLTALTNGALFKHALSTSLAATVTKTSSSSSTTPATASASADAELTQRIKALLDKGTSQTDVIASLSNSLAASVATALGIPLDAAKQKLTAAFTAALNPTGSGPPQSNAERATSLAQRFRQIAELATRVTKEDPGQTIRSISGKSSDAEQAGAGPAPSPDRIIRDAATALAATASSATPTIPTSQNEAALPVAQAPASDGRVVALPAATAIATGGDTPIGRILTRAVNINPIPASGDAVQTAAAETVQRSATPAAKSLDAPAPTVSTTSQNAETTGHTTVATALDAFVVAFDAALKRDNAPRSTGTPPADPNASLPSIPVDPTLAAGTTATSQQVAPALAVPTVNVVAAIAPPTPAPTLPQPVHVDPNAVVDQVLRGVNVRTSDGSSEVRLRLVPENLGDVSVKLIVNGGSVDASITTHTADAQNVLAGAQSQLAKTLADAGLKLQSFSVGLAGGGFANSRDQSSNQWANRSTSRRIGAVAAPDSEEPVDPSLLAEPSFAPPIYMASTPIGLNYLV